MPSLRSPQDLLANELKQIHSAERQLAKVLPKLARNISSDSLREMLDRRREEGGRLIEEIEGALDEIGLRAGRAQNPAIEGLIEGATQQAEQLDDDGMRDAALIGGIQKIEHYCIAAWGTSKALAGLLDHQTVVEAMERALEEGKRFDEEMTELAESEINPQLLSAESEEQDADQETSDNRRKRGGRRGRAGVRSAAGRTRKAAGASSGSTAKRGRGAAKSRSSSSSSGGKRQSRRGRSG